MKKRQLLAILLGMCFFTVSVSADSDKTRPQIGTIDIYEAVRIAEDLLLNDPDYVDRKLAISTIEKHYTQCNFLLVDVPCVCEDMQADKYVQLYPLDAYYKRIFDGLEGRIYWFIYFSLITDPSKIVLDGDIAFFIDAETSELIDVYRGG